MRRENEQAHRLDGPEWDQSTTGSDRAGGDMAEGLETFWTHRGERGFLDPFESLS